MNKYSIFLMINLLACVNIYSVEYTEQKTPLPTSARVIERAQIIIKDLREIAQKGENWLPQYYSYQTEMEYLLDSINKLLLQPISDADRQRLESIKGILEAFLQF